MVPPRTSKIQPARVDADERLQSIKERYQIEKAKALRLLARSAHSDWMDECVPALMDTGKDQTVAVAACLNMWRQAWEETHPDGADDPGPDRPD